MEALPDFRHQSAAAPTRQLETGISDLSGNIASIEAAVEANPFFGMAKESAAGALSQMISTIDQEWRAHCLAAGMTAEEIKRYQPAFDHEESRVARRITARSLL